MSRLLVGLDVGSTTVKAVAVEAYSRQILWREYQRHETRQLETVLAFLRRLETEIGLAVGADRLVVTGGAGAASRRSSARHSCRRSRRCRWPSKRIIRT